MAFIILKQSHYFLQQKAKDNRAAQRINKAQKVTKAEKKNHFSFSKQMVHGLIPFIQSWCISFMLPLYSPLPTAGGESGVQAYKDGGSACEDGTA